MVLNFQLVMMGLKNLKKGFLHCRHWSVSNNSIKIVDNIIGKGVHKIRSVLPLHPSVSAGDVREDPLILILVEI
jgi:hypothetical protein